MAERPQGRTTPPRFTRTVEDFVCAHCDALVEGDGYTNHCPRCLWSRHVDINPGDRLAECGGMMAPVSGSFERDRVVLLHRCVDCGHTRRNRAAADDDEATLREHLGRPVLPPPP